MQGRVFIGDLRDHVGKKVTVGASVEVRRDQGKLVFFELRDMTGSVQAVIPPGSSLLEGAKEVRQMYAVQVTGTVNKRPEKNVNPEKKNGDIELKIEELEIAGRAESLPFDLDSELHLETHLDYLPLTLRTQRSRDIFLMQATLLNAYRNSLKSQGFTEFMSPAIVGGDAEGGAAVFKIQYFKDNDAYLATSPQFYKQIMVGAFERSFTIAKVFRAEKSATTRHISEITQMDFEMGFIENELEPMRALEKTIKDAISAAVEMHGDMFERFNTQAPLLSDEFPILTLAEAHDILGVPHEPDMEPEHERNICAWAKEQKGSDFVFITRFPTKKRAFYTYEDPSEAPFSRGFDLLFRGLEINSGAQRIHDYGMLVARMKEHGLDPKKFHFYLMAFKYGMPPHGGSSTGLERFTARMLELPNVKEAASFPRDMTRIDARLSEDPAFE